MEQIIEYRSYAAAKSAFDANPQLTNGGRMFEWAKQLTFGAAQEAIDGE